MPSNTIGPVGGTLYWSINGRQYDLTGEFTIRKGGPKREGVPGLSGKGVGWTEAVEDGEVDCAFATVGALRLTDLEAITNASAQLECINGRKYITDTLYYREAEPMDPVKGTVKCKFGCIGAFREV